MRWLRLMLEIACHAGLLFVTSGIAAIVYANTGSRCSAFNASRIKCATPFDTQIAEYGMGVTLITAFTGVSGLLALGGIGFIIWRLIRRADNSKLHKGQRSA